MKHFIFFVLPAILLMTAGCVKDEQVRVFVESVTLNETSISIFKNGTSRLTATILPENSTIRTVSWGSSNPEIASVDETGNVTAHKLGKAVITVISGSAMDNCIVNVVARPVEDISIPENIRVCIGDTCHMAATTIPDECDIQDIKWSSADVSIANISSGGIVTGISEGNTVIYAEIEGRKAECIVTVMPAPQFGDFYYSDGTWSDELESGKTPIGIVFWTGDPTEYDKILAQDHPDCTNGLAVALDEMTSNWQTYFVFYSGTMPEYGGMVSNWIAENSSREYASIAPSTDEDSDFHKIMGYNNTKAIEEFNAAVTDFPVDVVNAVVDYRSRVQAPAASSGWYVPSVKELAVICSYDSPSISFDYEGGSNRDALNTRLSLIDSATPLDIRGWYWASTEYCFNPKYSWDYRFFTGVIHYNDRSTEEKLRPVLAF